MLIAAIETSGRAGSVALCNTASPAVPESASAAVAGPGLVIASRSLDRTGRRHARTLVAELDQLFRDSGHTLTDCEAVAVSIGPGSFTGLRVGVACAKTLAWATGCRVLGVDTLQCVALQTMNRRPDVSDVWAIADAQRGDVAVRLYRRPAEAPFQPEAAGPLSLEPAEDWCSQRTANELVTGPGLAKFRDLLNSRCQLAEPELCEPLAASVLQLAAGPLLAGQTDDAWSLEPHYTRRSAAEEKADAARTN